MNAESADAAGIVELAAESARVGKEFIGRQSELGLVRAGLDRLALGDASFYLVFGPPGIGKSHFLLQCSREAGGRGATVLWGKSWDAGGAPPYWPWIQIYRSYLGSIPSDEVEEVLRPDSLPLVQILDEWRGLLAEGDRSRIEQDPELARFRLFEAAVQALFRIAGRNPTVLLLEDMHAADIPSLLLLRFLAGQLHDRPLMVLASHRRPVLGPDAESAPILEELVREPVVVPVALREFNENEIEEFVVNMSGFLPDRQLVTGLKRRTKGNPLFLGKTIELISAPAKGGAITDLSELHLEIPAGLRELIQARIRDLPEDVQTVFEAAVVLGEEMSFESLRRLCDLTPEQLLEFVGIGRSNGLLEAPGAPGRLRFSHDLVRASIYEGLTPARRAELHARAARMLEDDQESDSPARLAELAYHSFEAVPLVDAARSVEYLKRAAGEAVNTLAYEEAVRLYRMGLSLLEGIDRVEPKQTIDLLLALADSEVKSGDLRAAKASYLRVAGLAKQTGAVLELARAAVGYGGRFLYTRKGDDPHVVPLLQDALLLLGGEDDPLRVRLLGRLAGALRGIEQPALLDNLSRQALELARSLEDPPTLAYALAARLGAMWRPGASEERLPLSRELIQLAERLGDFERTVDGHMMEMSALFELGDIVGVKRAVSVLDRYRDDIRQPSHEWLRAGISVMLATFEGEFELAEALVESLRTVGLISSAHDEISIETYQSYQLARHRGRLTEVEAKLRAAARDMPWYPTHQINLSFLLAQSGRANEASSLLDDVIGEGLDSIPFDNYHLLNLALLVEVCDLLDALTYMSDLHERLRPYSGLNTLGLPEGSVGAVDRYLGLAAFRLGDLDAADRHFRAAIRMNKAMSARPWLVLTQLDTARYLTVRDAQGDREEASKLIEEASHLAAQIAMTVTGKAVDVTMLQKGSIPDTPRSPQRSTGVFRREGEYFTVSFGGASSRMRDTKGLRYLAHLLSAPGQEFHALMLVSLVEGNLLKPADIDTGEVMASKSDSQAVIDRQALDAYKSRLVELEEDIDEAEESGDSHRAERAREEREFIAEELSAAIGLAGRARVFTSESERARVSVTRAIRSAMRRMLDEIPLLGEHLDATIRTGVFCSYRPDPAVTPIWVLN